MQNWTGDVYFKDRTPEQSELLKLVASRIADDYLIEWDQDVWINLDEDLFLDMGGNQFAVDGNVTISNRDQIIQQTEEGICRTRACIAGSAVFFDPKETYEIHFKTSSNAVPLKNNTEVFWEDAARELLGLDEDEADKLFAGWQGWGGPPEDYPVADLLVRLADGLHLRTFLNRYGEFIHPSNV